MTFLQKDNPYTLQFALVPPQYISRAALTEEIVGDLIKNVPTFRGYFLTGVRGSGKTATMTDISQRITVEPGWISIDIANPESDIIDSLARALYRIPELRSIFIKAKLDFSILGIGVSLEKADMIASDAEDAADIMLSILKKKQKKVLVTIDEVTYGKEISAFSHTMSSYARKGYDIYVLMTGLTNNINKIKNNKSLTFLYRAKEVELPPLNRSAIINDYQSVFGIGRSAAADMADLTKGYAFAFQVLGYLYWKSLSADKTARIEDTMTDYDYYLSEFVYEKIWSETTRKEKDILKALSVASQSPASVSEIKTMCNIESGDLSVYRERLIQKGIIDGSERGYIAFALPRFSEFINSLWK